MKECLEHQENFSRHQDTIPEHCFIFKKNHDRPITSNYISVPYVLAKNVMVHGHYYLKTQKPRDLISIVITMFRYVEGFRDIALLFINSVQVLKLCLDECLSNISQF